MQNDKLKTRKTARAANRQGTPSAQATTQDMTAKPAAPIETGPPVLPRKAAPQALPARTVDPPKSLPTRVHRLPEADKPEPQPEAPPTPRGPKWWWAQWARVRWVAALAALISALVAQKIADDARVANNALGAPPTLSWVLLGLAAVLFVVGVPASPAPPT